jgi:hypothetical protein
MIFVSFPIKKIRSPALIVFPVSHLTSCTPTKANLYITNSLATVVKWTWPVQAPHIPCTKSLFSFPSFRLYQRICPSMRKLWPFCNKASFYGVALLAPRSTPKLGDHPLCAIHDCLFNIFTATLYIGGCSSIRNLRMRHVVVTGTH